MKTKESLSRFVKMRDKNEKKVGRKFLSESRYGK
jgi:hypothetical protein